MNVEEKMDVERAEEDDKVNVKLLSIRDLQEQCRPLTGALSLDPFPSLSSCLVSSFNEEDAEDHNPSGSGPETHTKKKRKCPDNPGNGSEHDVSEKTLEPLKRPSILIGTIRLWNANANLNTNYGTCPHFQNGQCLAFTDHTKSCSICCAVLELDPCVIGRQIHILSWNFIPSSGSCGYPSLEINKWRLDPAPSALVNLCLEIPPFPKREKEGLSEISVSPQRQKQRLHGRETPCSKNEGLHETPSSSKREKEGLLCRCTTVCGRLCAISPHFFLPCTKLDKMPLPTTKTINQNGIYHRARQPPPPPPAADNIYKCHAHVFNDNHRDFTTKRSNSTMHEQTKLLPAGGRSKDKNIGEILKKNAMENVLGFLIELRMCNHKPQCKLSSQKHEKQHVCVKPTFVYFIESSTAWYPVLASLFGKCLAVTGLKKKVMLAGKEKEEYIVFVATTTTMLNLLDAFPCNSHPNTIKVLQRRLASGLDNCKSTTTSNVDIWPGLPKTPRMSIGNLNKEGQGSTGSYIGIVTGIHMQGLLIGLDNNAWLLLTHQPLTQVHGLRIGALLGLRHVHFNKIQFACEKVLVLGACFKSHIVVTSFSPLKTMFNLRPYAWSLLSRYIEFLPFMAGFWVLLITICFKHKFRGFFSEKEILGSKDGKGMVQRYVHSWCSSFCLQRDVLKEFFKHESCHMGRPTKTILQLVIPLINFCRQIEAMWSDHGSIIWKAERHRCKEASSLVHCEKEDLFVNKVVDGRRFVRRIISSKEFGVVLIGILEVSQQSGQLQLVDATGAVDVVVPDFVSSSSLQNFYEVTDFHVVVEGFRGRMWSLETKDDVQPISCARIIDGLVSKHKLTSVTYYIHFYLKNATKFNVPRCPVSCLNKSSHVKMQELQQRRVFSTLLVIHKYPITGKLVFDASDQNSAKSFAEAILLPYTIVMKDGEHSSLNKSHLKLETSDKLEDAIAVTDGSTSCCLETLKMIESKSSMPLICSKTRKEDEMNSSNCANASINSMKCDVSASISCDGHGRQSHLLGGCYNEQSVSENYSKRFQLETSQEIQCSLHFRNLYKDDVLLYGVLFSPMNSQGPRKLLEDPCSKKVLLEFNSESLNYYQLLRIGDCYLIQHQAEGCSVDISRASKHIKTNKIVVSPYRPIWCFSIASDNHFAQQNCHQTCFPSFFTSHNTPSLALQFSDINKYASHENVENETSSIGWHRQAESVHPRDVILYVPCESVNPMQRFIKHVKQDMIPVIMDTCDTFDKYFAHKDVPSYPEQFPKAGEFDGSISHDSDLLNGEFISVSGEVKDVHWEELNPFANLNKFGCKHLSRGSNITFLPKSRYTIYVQGSQGSQKVRICGIINRCFLPLGFGPGVYASFYRLLLQRDLLGRQELLVSSASFIVVNAIKEVEYHCNSGDNGNTEVSDSLPSPNDSANKDLVLISSISQSSDVDCFRLCCRVVAVQSLVLEWQPSECKSAFPYIGNCMDVFDFVQIISGRFILDDGSGLCECWASGRRAASLLNIYSTGAICFESVASLCNISNKGSKKKHKNTVGLLVKKLVKKHRQVTIQKNESVISSNADITIFGASQEILNSEERSLISFVLQKACNSAPLMIISSILDSADQQAGGLGKYDELQANTDKENFITLTQRRRNILARDVFPINYLQEAGNAVQELISEI